MKVFKHIEKGHLNSNNTLFGGELMKWMDELAHKSALEFSCTNSVTVKVKELCFLCPVFEGNNIMIESILKHSRGCQMEFEIYSYIIGDSIIKNAESTFIMAATDKNGKPVRIR
ncbi:MAG: hypothetical protein C0596_00970 [Marinilabiliales bacterium]|nr:MAG: hypothetical protein C0596_00970 [Marinilabiliales bacterium]